MKISRLQKFLLAICPPLGARYLALRVLIGKSDSVLYRTGWMESLRRGHPARPDGSAMPWLNYAITAFLEERLERSHSVFEWGSGYSTIFFAQRAGSVTSVEYSPGWYELIRARVPENVRVLFREKDRDGQYCRAILADDARYDIVLVDGRDRVNCLRQGIERLTPRGVLLLDDAERERYREGIEFARARGFRALAFEGMKPMEFRPGRTMLFYRPDNCLGL